MKTIFKIMSLIIILSFTQACSSEPETSPVELSTYENTTWLGELPIKQQILVITAVVDEVALEDFVINRGNITWSVRTMKNFAHLKLPHKLKFGETIELNISGVPREVEAITDLGDWTFTF